MKLRNVAIAWVAFALPVLVLAAVLWRGPGDATAQQKIVWKVQSTWPANNLLHISALELAKMIEEMSGGRFKWEMSAAGTVVGAFEVLDAVNRGIIDASHAWPGYWAGKNSAAGLFAPGPGGPFGMDREEYLGWLFAGGGLELYNELLQKELKMNVVVPVFTTSLPYWEPLGWFKKPFNNLDDLRKMRFRTSGLGMEMMQGMGVSVVTLAGGEVIPALERGAIDGAEWVNCSDDKVLGIDKIAKFHYAPGMHEPVTVGEFIINKGKWDALPADLKEIVKVSVQASYWNHFVRFQEKTAKACQELIASGIKIIKTTDELNRAFLKAYDEIVATNVAKDEFYKKVIDSQKKYSGLVVPYRLSYWPNYNFIAEHYYKEKIWLK